LPAAPTRNLFAKYFKNAGCEYKTVARLNKNELIYRKYPALEKINKKQIERLHLEKFISNEKLALPVLHIQDLETPDFVLKMEERLVSVEHTRLLNPILQEKESYKDKIIKEAQRLFEGKYPEKLYALITFHNKELEPGKKKRDEYILHVFETIEKIYLHNQTFEFHLSSNDDYEDDLIENIDLNNKYNFSHWQHFGAYVVDQIDADWFKGVIRNKEKNIRKYPKQFDENWLLLVADFGTQASTNSFYGFDFSEIESEFDKIYMYSYMPDSITVVK
jgi:hypothetical protein